MLGRYRETYISRVGQAKEKLVGHVIREVSHTDDGRPGRHCCILAFTLNDMGKSPKCFEYRSKIIRLSFQMDCPGCYVHEKREEQKQQGDQTGDD